ncbi:MAG TPA: MacB family efflux pump subunit [Steroidobacteraceae bacterium]|nr:MacB family efflux pump subunit [Steroidobacteraceae bacterium]
MTQPLLRLRGVGREYPAGDEPIAALRGVDLDIEAGEFVAVVGASGSGKSTLMNVLGCLDRPTKGSYEVSGRNTAGLEPDELAQLRREHFGFIFQRYHLLTDLSAAGNVEMPAIYAGQRTTARHARARALLTRLGMADRLGHRPGQLSGGQQQRVSIARALMNGGQVILADEPTGALDSHAGAEVMRILEELHEEGHTIILVTHDMGVAEHAQRIIELHDGAVLRDQPNPRHPRTHPREAAAPSGKPAGWLSLRDRFVEAFSMAIRAMAAHRMRTFLTMLGIIIGIASVVTVVALGAGSQQQILAQIGALGTNTIDVYSGSLMGDLRSVTIRPLRAADADALAAQGYVDSATPNVGASATLRYGNIAASAQVSGVGAQYFRVRGIQLAAGSTFGLQSVDRLEQVLIIDDNTRSRLFPSRRTDPIGQVVLLNNVPCRVIGVLAKQPNNFTGGNLTVYAPYSMVMSRLMGRAYISSITVRVSDDTPMDAAEAAINKLMMARHGGQKDFFLNNSANVRETIQSETRTMTLLIGSIAGIALLVGGIGVMNIMLVSVTERTREIGVRMAVGARQGDILQQFLIEAVLVCLVGGALGVLLALGAAALISSVVKNFPMIVSIDSVIAAFACSTAIGIVFGFLPARNAARLDPVEALARE